MEAVQAMQSIAENPDLLTNLDDLRRESLKVVAASSSFIGLIWFVWVINPATGGTRPSLEAWIGSGMLAVSAFVSYVLGDRFLRAASVLFVLGTLAAVALAVPVFPSPVTFCLFVLPVIFASVLFSQPAFLLTALGAASIIVLFSLALSSSRLLGSGSLIAPADILFPTIVFASVALASWLSVHNLHTALAWVWHGYAHARQNEEVARERQAELRRALKALDEATHRLERVNYMMALACDEAREARRLKQQFAQTISHELRTPLNLIVGFTGLMTESPEHYGSLLPPAYLRDLNIVHRNACHLQDLVNDVLDLARIEAAQMSLSPEETDPEALAREAVETARSLIEVRGLMLRTEIAPGLPKLWIDPTRIRQVLFNLLNNAARFTEQGSVTVRVCCQDGQKEAVDKLTEVATTNVVFAVADTGMGIAPEDMHSIFEEFRQADGSTRRRHGGVGLGLAISRRFVELHGGHIWVESQVGQGSTFYFSLPISRDDLDPRLDSYFARSAGKVSVKAGEEPVLLVVTRSPSAAVLLTRYVRGCRTVVLPDLEQAQAAACQLMPQAVIVDRACEALDQAALEGIGREWGVPRIHFLLCPLPGEELLRQRLAVDGYLIKPVSRQSLWDVLRHLGEDIDRVLVVDDDRDFVLLLSRMLEDNPVRRYQVAGAYSGQEGLAMMGHCQPDLVLLDLVLPDIDGFEVVGRIRATPEWQQIPIVVVSAQDEADTRETLKGALTITRVGGLTPGEVVQWVQNVVDAASLTNARATEVATTNAVPLVATRSLPVTPVLQAAPVR